MASQSREPEGTPAGEGGVSDTNLPPAMEAPYRDNFDDDTESTPFLQGGEQDGGPSNSSARRPPSDEEQPPAAASQGEDDTSRPRRRFNYVLFHGMTLVLAIMLPLIILAMTLLSELVGRKVRYDLPWSVGYRFQGILFNSVVTIAWATTNLLRHRRTGTLSSLGFGTLLHAFLALFTLGPAMEGFEAMGPDAASNRCHQYYDPDEDRLQRCVEFATKFHILVYSYLALLIVFGLLHAILWVACLTPTYRSWTWPPRGWSENGFRVPGGEVSLQFTVRFLRQDSPPVRPIQTVPRVAPEPPVVGLV